MTEARKPFFRFHPNAYRPGGYLEQSDACCDACGLACEWRYTGGVYAVPALGTLCAQCIAEGRTGEALGTQDYEFQDTNLADADGDAAEELLKRTPGVACFNPFEWPLLDGMPLAFIGAGDEAALVAIPEVRAAIATAFEAIGWDRHEESPYALVFREVEGMRWQAVIDLD